MKKIFWGFIFIFFNFSLNIGNVHLELMPDFIGYILLALGFFSLAVQSEGFKKLVPFTWIAAVYSAVALCINFLCGIADFSMPLLISRGIGIVSLVLFLCISYFAVKNVGELFALINPEVPFKPLKTAWTIMAVTEVIAALYTFVPLIAFLTIVIIAVSLAAKVFFTYQLYKFTRLEGMTVPKRDFGDELFSEYSDS